MSVTIKSNSEIKRMREAGRILYEVHEELGKALHVGMSTWEIDQLGRELIKKSGCEASFLGYNGYPAAICVSVNDEVVHGIPSKTRILMDGDIVSLDAGVIYQGYHSDAARTHVVGNAGEEINRLIETTRQSFYEGIRYAKPGHHLYEISRTIQKYVESHGYSVVRELVGHGIGKNLHEDPKIPNFRMPGRGILLEPGMTLAIEPMVNAGKKEVEWLDDDWTVVTKDGSLSAHYENTVLITEGEPELLSMPEVSAFS